MDRVAPFTRRSRALVVFGMVFLLAGMLLAGCSSGDGVGLYPVRVHDQWGYIDRTGKVVIEPQYEKASAFSDSLAAVTVKGKVGYIDETGQFVIQPQFNDGRSFSEGLAGVLLDDKWGFIDHSGKVVIAPQLFGPPELVDWPYDFSEGLASVTLDGDN